MALRLFTNRFAILALLCIVGLALSMAFVLSSLLGRAVSDWEWEYTAALVRREVERENLVPLLSSASSSETTARLALALPRILGGLPEVTRIKVWNAQATVLWSDEARLIGQSFPDDHEVKDALAGKVSVEIKPLRRAENVYDPQGARLAEADRVKSRFVASVSHELRTPLNAILGFARVLLRTPNGGLDIQQAGWVRAIEKSGTYLLQLVSTVLEASRLQAGRELASDRFEVGPLVEECLEAARILAGGKSITVDADVAPEVGTIQADRTAVKQILLNLLSNAVKFTRQGTVTLRVRAEPGTVHISVHDTGVGIRNSDLARAFEAFVRLEPALETEEGGSGLGLAVTRSLVELHNGKVWAESREHAGSTFHVILPQP